MPGEYEPHARTWMAWPSAAYTLGDSPASADEAWSTWAAVANAVADFEPLVILASPSGFDTPLHGYSTTGIAEARRRLSGAIDIVEAELDDAWYRDIGPTFVTSVQTNLAGLPEVELGAVNWTFNGWGAQEWASWQHDQDASIVATDYTGAARIDSAMVNEGGGIHTDGYGTFLVTETVQLDPGRNPGWTKQQVEEELARTVGARQVIWLPRGLTRDSSTYGTRGHIDLVATFAAPGRVLAHVQRDPSHPDHEVSARNLEVLHAAVDAEGHALEIVELPAPRVLADEDGPVDYSYVNHYVVNGAVIACSFDDPADEEARAILANAYPGREIVAVDARPLFARGGGIHCITQQEPAVGEVSIQPVAHSTTARQE